VVWIKLIWLKMCTNGRAHVNTVTNVSFRKIMGNLSVAVKWRLLKTELSSIKLVVYV
jgi:hypothetical protein